LAACVHRGCKVIAVDVSDKQLALAREFGADFTINGSTENVLDKVMEITADGADVVFECTGIPECVNSSIQLCKTFGSYVWQGNYGAKPVGFDFLPAHGRQLKMFFPCDDGQAACRRAVVRNMGMGALKWEKVITHRIDSSEAPEFFSRINKGDKDIIGVVIDWGNINQ
jgi:threonine dehydrogenase-like Zn-dependent dehydrogenase